MALTILDSATAAAVAAAYSQADQCAALAAPWAGSAVTVRVMQGSTLRASNTHAAWIFNSATPRGIVLGARAARTPFTAGPPDLIVFRAGATDIFQITAAVGSGGDYNFAGAISALCRERMDGLTINANSSLPLVSPPLRLVLSGTGTVGTPASGTVFNDGTTPAAFALAGTGLTVSPASGTVAGGASMGFTVSAVAAAVYSLILTNGTGGAVSGSPAGITISPAPTYGPLVQSGVPGTVAIGSAATGTTLTNNGTGSVSWSYTAITGLTISPSSGTLAGGASVAITLTPTVLGTYTLTPINGSGGSVTGGGASLNAVAAAFASGASSGSYNSGTATWTPNRAGSGLVYQTSWDEVPTGRWVSVAGTSIDGLTSAITAPGWDSSSLAWAGVMNAWNGFAVDTTQSRLWLVAAGGHADCSNNGLYRFDCFRMAWAVEHQPSDRSAWSTNYKTLAGTQGGSYTTCYESIQQRQAQQTAGTWSALNAAGAAWGDDELYWDNRPCSRHTYSAVAYSAGTQELIVGSGAPGAYNSGRRIWRYSLTSGDWTAKYAVGYSMDGAANYGFIDASRGLYLVGGIGDGIGKAVSLSLADGSVNGGNWAPWVIYGVIDSQYGDVVTAFSPPVGDNGGTYPGKYWTLNLTSRASTGATNVQFGSGLSISDFPFANSGTNNGGGGMCYVPSLGVYWVLMMMNNGAMTWMQIDTATTPWTMSRLTFASGAPPSQDKPCRKLIYLPGLNAVVFFSGGSTPAYVYKF